jgi:hypothetical protein
MQRIGRLRERKKSYRGLLSAVARGLVLYLAFQGFKELFLFQIFAITLVSAKVMAFVFFTCNCPAPSLFSLVSTTVQERAR